MVKFGILATIKAKPGKEEEVAELLSQAIDAVQIEKQTINWYAFQLGEGKFGIFDTFESESGRDEHLAGKVVEALMSKTPELFSEGPVVSLVDIIAAK